MRNFVSRIKIGLSAQKKREIMDMHGLVLETSQFDRQIQRLYQWIHTNRQHFLQ